ncbi:uncharacterized protein LTR77_003826 [Saxophila tyrrhenica]|uniref:Uncharacterized protein n=1 Tax=Saxophila tyrrhenica TaxID=1690608 RepID=A0AAV9PEX4_9PEZI|nr:hypothetical protein LTR77_003826 [Saxophila tyrrhenica]
MPSRIDDRWLWLSFGVISIATIYGIRLAFQDLISLTKLDPHDDEERKKDEEHPEDAISLKDLKTLTTSPNSAIANSAISLTVSRVQRDPSVTTSIRRDLRSADPRTRFLATTALDFLCHHPSYPGHDADRPSRRLPYDDFGRSTPDRVPNESETEWVVAQLARRAEASDPVAGQMMGLVERARTIDPGGMFGPPDERNPWVGEGEEGVVPSIEDPVAGWTNVPRARPQPGGGTAEEDAAELRRSRREAVVMIDPHGHVIVE